MSKVAWQFLRNGLLMLVLLCQFVSAARTQASSLSNVLLLVTDNAAHTQLSMLPIDPESLQDIGGYAPISMGHHYVSALSSDHSTLAAIVWPDSNRAGGVLHLVDVRQWRDQAVAGTFDDTVQALIFSHDGATLYWVEPTAIEATHGLPQSFEVVRCNISSCAVATPLVTLPKHFMPYETRLLKSGAELAVFGIPTDSDNLATGAPEVTLVDLVDGRVSATIALDGLVAGQRQVRLPDPNRPADYESNQPGLAWNLDANLLYVAHPTTDQLTIIDLSSHSIVQQTYGSYGKMQGSAKLFAGTDRLATLNPAGSLLYISTFHRETITNADGNSSVIMLPLGLEMIDTRQMKELAHVNLPLFEMALSPDGRFLLATGMSRVQPEDAQDKLTMSGLYILDAANLQTLKHVETADELVYIQGFSPDGRYAYTNFQTVDGDPGTSILRAIDLSNLSLSAERVIAPGYSELLGTQG